MEQKKRPAIMPAVRDLYRAAVQDPQELRHILQEHGRPATRYDIAPQLWNTKAAPYILQDIALYIKATA